MRAQITHILTCFLMFLECQLSMCHIPSLLPCDAKHLSPNFILFAVAGFWTHDQIRYHKSKLYVPDSSTSQVGVFQAASENLMPDLKDQKSTYLPAAHLGTKAAAGNFDSTLLLGISEARAL